MAEDEQERMSSIQIVMVAFSCVLFLVMVAYGVQRALALRGVRHKRYDEVSLDEYDDDGGGMEMTEFGADQDFPGQSQVGDVYLHKAVDPGLDIGLDLGTMLGLSLTLNLDLDGGCVSNNPSLDVTSQQSRRRNQRGRGGWPVAVVAPAASAASWLRPWWWRRRLGLAKATRGLARSAACAQ
eukprot:CAMPEP_0182537850 /NCGR_PEP_ID=MMETSP1323-20130603/22683_1 /TAXON_ID=236787 /ORGANISM="Florenciella parvula, Strain RCC1693" /LENGTH=181 /DNA_ID=CAMNT_0024748273 /DNA_START=47 /DNA_END=594 /DNA_ORIENTATION=+